MSLTARSTTVLNNSFELLTHACSRLRRLRVRRTLRKADRIWGGSSASSAIRQSILITKLIRSVASISRSQRARRSSSWFGAGSKCSVVSRWTCPADISEANGGIVNLRHAARAALGTAFAADLEQVGEIGVETHFERDRPPDGAEAAQPNAFIAGGAAQEFQAADINRIALQPDLAVGIVKVDVGQIDDHRSIIVEHDRAQLKRRHPANLHRKGG